MRNTTLLLILCFFFISNGCKKEEKPAPPSPEKELISLQLDAAINASFINETISGTIQGTEIKLTIPELTDASKLKATFTFKGESVFVGAVKQESKVTENDFTKPITYTVIAADGSHQDYIVKVTIAPLLKSVVPHIYIDTENGAPVDSKDNYVKATIRIDGAELYKDYEGQTSIKGRGNSTWGFPKKPYRLKLAQKSDLLGLSPEKDWILLANYLDPTLMLNAVALKTGQLLKMPFTNHVIPVDVTLNGAYIGNYMFTEQKEVEDNRINVGDDGLLIEFDTYFDEDFKFHSAKYNLPVMVDYPELDDLSATEAQAQLNLIQNDFNNMEQMVNDPSFPNNHYLDYVDATSFVNYLLVYNLCLNEEINHPKSTYMYKLKGGKYCMGPIWDFDWAFGYEGTYQHFSNPTKELFWNSSESGTRFFGRIFQDPAIKAQFRKVWIQFKSEKFPDLLKYIDDYAAIIKDSYTKNQNRWSTSRIELQTYVQRMKTWLNARAAFLDSYTSGW